MTDWKEAARHYRTLYHEAVEKGCSDRDFWRGRTFAVEREGAEHRREMQAEIARLSNALAARTDRAELEALRAALEDIKLRYDDEGKDAARDMWRVAYEALDALAATARPSAAPAEGREGE